MSSTPSAADILRALATKFPERRIRVAPLDSIHVQVERGSDVVIDMDAQVVNVSLEGYDATEGVSDFKEWAQIPRNGHALARVPSAVGKAIAFIEEVLASRP